MAESSGSDRRYTQTTVAVVLAVKSLKLMCQNAANVLLQHRLQTRQEDDSLQYEPLSAVVLSEGLKMFISVAGAALGFYHNTPSDSAPSSGFLSYMCNGHESAAVPAFLYTLSATSQSIGAYNLDILTYLMLSQAKLILTPVFSKALLKQTLQPHQWLCLLVMATGIVLVQISSTARSFGGLSANEAGGDMIFGTVSMLLAGVCSAFASVYMEAVLKNSGHSLNFMVRNAQLAAYTCLCALGGLMWQSDMDIKGCFRGYTVLVWALVLLQATGGFLVSWAVRIASTIAKNYAQSLGFLAALTIPLVLSPHKLSAEG
ncbi:hypothetical protein Daus18300_002733 [Diaporthe australafricana]|uniref:UDP-galactose transporter n=1 Tax=Diaporthe australafricana TaxID=127596 RepID=A0ABR3XKJ2_9PEZI